MRDELGTHHGLTIPMRGRVEGQFEALIFTGIGGILVRGIEVEVGRGGGAAVDVPLVFSNLVAP